MIKPLLLIDFHLDNIIAKSSISVYEPFTALEVFWIGFLVGIHDSNNRQSHVWDFFYFLAKLIQIKSRRTFVALTTSRCGGPVRRGFAVSHDEKMATFFKMYGKWGNNLINRQQVQGCVHKIDDTLAILIAYIKVSTGTDCRLLCAELTIKITRNGSMIIGRHVTGLYLDLLPKTMFLVIQSTCLRT